MTAIDREPRLADGGVGTGPQQPCDAGDPHREALLRAMAALRARLDARTGGLPSDIAWPEPSANAALAAISRRLGLDVFEQAVLVMCAGVELDAGLAEAVAAAGGPTFGVALAALPESHWSALRPAAPLRAWRLVEPADEARSWRGLTTTPLRLDEAVLHMLVGLPYDDVRLRGALRVGAVEGWGAAEATMPEPSGAAIHRLCAAWSGMAAEPVLVQLRGPDMESACRVAAAAARRVWSASIAVVAPADVPASTLERDAFRVALERHAILAGAVLLIDGTRDGDATRAVELAEELRVPGAVILGDALPAARRPVLRIDVDRPTPAEQARCWRSLLSEAGECSSGAEIDATLDRITDQFRLGAAALRGAMAASRLALGPKIVAGAGAGIDAGNGGDAGSDVGAIIWSACREQSRARVEDLAPRVRSAATWEDLVLPPSIIETLRAIAAQARHRGVVHERWGFAHRSGRGVGTTALFAGASGTGKSLAAEVIANDLGLDLHRIDLSAVVSKYIGETEKNLRRVFDAAEEGGAVLVFDEADALFGRRSEVRDSHDRYANIEVSYLLQRMDDYRGVAILTTNHRALLDEAFLRRLRHAVEFPFPDASMREALWRRIFPGQTPVEGLEHARLARLALPGGSIANIALMAAYLAAADGKVVRMRHVQQAARRELAKLERAGAEEEVGQWT